MSYVLHNQPQNASVTNNDHKGNITLEWKQGINDNRNTPWRVTADIFVSRQNVLLSIQRILVQEPMDSFSYEVLEPEHVYFRNAIDQLLQQLHSS